VDGAARSLRIVRRFGVAPQAVFDAFTVPEAMRAWWTDDTTFDVDLRVGGRWTIVREDGDDAYVMQGEYLEVEPPQRLRFTIGMPQFSPNLDTISLEIRPDGAGCVVVLVTSICRPSTVVSSGSASACAYAVGEPSSSSGVADVASAASKAASAAPATAR